MNERKKMICPACGSDQVDEHVEDRQLTFPYVGDLGFKEVVNHCAVCGTEGDFARVNETAITAVENEAKRIGIENMLGYLNNDGHTMAYMERALDLPQRTMMRWKSGECSASSLALLRMVRTYPWLLKSAESKFDPIKSLQILCTEGIKAVGNLIVTMNPSARIEVIVDSKQADQVKFTTAVTTAKKVDYSNFQLVAGGS